MFSLKDRAAVVTGGSSGIGLAICRRFLAAGARVISLDLQSPPETEEDGFSLSHIRTDVSKEACLSDAFDQAKQQLGGLDIVVNNAAIQPLGVRFEDLTPALLEKSYQVNVFGTAYGIKHASRLLTTGGRILNTSSYVGLTGVPNAAIYASTKAAVVHLTKLAALELAPRQITVNCVCPNTARTPAVLEIPDNPEIPFVESRTPLGRLAEPEEIAAAFHFLASPEASYITGAVLSVDGGISAGWERLDVVTPPNISGGEWKS